MTNLISLRLAEAASVIPNGCGKCVKADTGRFERSRRNISVLKSSTTCHTLPMHFASISRRCNAKRRRIRRPKMRSAPSLATRRSTRLRPRRTQVRQGGQEANDLFLQGRRAVDDDHLLVGIRELERCELAVQK